MREASPAGVLAFSFRHVGAILVTNNPVAGLETVRFESRTRPFVHLANRFLHLIQRENTGLH